MHELPDDTAGTFVPLLILLAHDPIAHDADALWCEGYLIEQATVAFSSSFAMDAITWHSFMQRAATLQAIHHDYPHLKDWHQRWRMTHGSTS